MSPFVPIHGAWQGGWCWDKTVPWLEKRGHTVLAPDLPGHGRDSTLLSMVALSSYVDSVCEIVDALPRTRLPARAIIRPMTQLGGHYAIWAPSADPEHHTLRRVWDRTVRCTSPIGQ